MRFAGEAIQKYTGDSDVSEHGRAWQKSHQQMQQKPVVPGFNTEDLIETPELPSGHPFEQHRKGNYILNNPAVALVYCLMESKVHRKDLTFLLKITAVNICQMVVNLVAISQDLWQQYQLDYCLKFL